MVCLLVELPLDEVDCEDDDFCATVVLSLAAADVPKIKPSYIQRNAFATNLAMQT